MSTRPRLTRSSYALTSHSGSKASGAQMGSLHAWASRASCTGVMGPAPACQYAAAAPPPAALVAASEASVARLAAELPSLDLSLAAFSASSASALARSAA